MKKVLQNSLVWAMCLALLGSLLMPWALAEDETPWNLLRFGILVDARDLAVRDAVYGGMVAFSRSELPATLTWQGDLPMSLWFNPMAPLPLEEDMPTDPSGAEIIRFTPEELALQKTVGGVMGIDDFHALDGLHTVSYYLYLENTWFSERLLQRELLPNLDMLPRASLLGVAHEVEDTVLGTAYYEAPGNAVHEYLNNVNTSMVWKLLNSSIANCRGQREVEPNENDYYIDANTGEHIFMSKELKEESLICEGFILMRFDETETEVSGLDFAKGYFSTEMDLSVKPVINELTGAPRYASDDGTPLYELNGVIPIHNGILLPDRTANANIHTVVFDQAELRVATFLRALEDEDAVSEPLPGAGSVISESLPFDVGSIFAYESLPYQGIGLGWIDEAIEPDFDAILAAAAELPDILSVSRMTDEIEELRQAVGADMAFALERNDLVQIAASADEHGYTGATLVVLYAEPITFDLNLASLASTNIAAGVPATASIGVTNSASDGVYTTLSISISNPYKHYTFPVYVAPGTNFYTVRYETPSNGGQVRLTAEINPGHNPLELNYENNVMTLDLRFAPPAPPTNGATGRAAYHTWEELRKHVYQEPLVIYEGEGREGEYSEENMVMVTCWHYYSYEASISAGLRYEYGNPEEIFNALTMKSGYGFNPLLAVTGTGPTYLPLLERIVSETGGCNHPDHAPDKESEATLHWPDEAVFSWRPNFSLGHSYPSYEVSDSDNPRIAARFIQPSTDIAMEHLGISGRVSRFEAAQNPISQIAAKRIYTHEALKDGDHEFLIEVDGGTVEYTYIEYSYVEGLGEVPSVYHTYLDYFGLDEIGEVTIAGTMYEDDFTGARR